MVFSTNQARQFYVATALATGTPAAEGQINAITNNGDVWLNHYGKGGLTRSDLLTNIISAKAVKASDLALKKNQVTFTVTSAAGSKNYIVKVIIRNAYGISGYDNLTRVLQVTSAATTSVNALATQIANAINADKELANFVVASTPSSGAFTITEVEQPWKLGKMPVDQVLFDVMCVPQDGVTASVLNNTFTYDWATCAEGQSTTDILPEGKLIADLEYFCMGERADLYRGAGYPNNIDTEYMVDYTKEYSIIDIHYAYVGDGENPQKSEKTLTIAVPNGASGSEYTTINAIIADINTAAGTSIATLA